jgi:hypothetical protein
MCSSEALSPNRWEPVVLGTSQVDEMRIGELLAGSRVSGFTERLSSHDLEDNGVRVTSLAEV